MVRFLHTADLQLGMAFREIPGDRGAKLREIRLEVIERIGRVARDEECEFVVVAGDLFDDHRVDPRTVHQACSRFGEIGIPVYVLPGNHDAAFGAGSVYRQPAFEGRRETSIELLDSYEPRVILDGRVVLLAAPLLQRHVVGDPTDRWTPELGCDLAEDAIRVGVAHGGVVDFAGYDEGVAENLIDPERAAKTKLDFLAWTDGERLERFFNVLWRASRQLQIILVTCHWDRYRELGVPESHVTDIQKLRRDVGVEST